MTLSDHEVGLDGVPHYPRLRDPHPEGYDKGRGFLWQAGWFAVQNLVFGKWWCPGWARPRILQLFGAKIGSNVFIRHRVRVLWPWKLEISDDVLVGEDVWLLNLEPIRIGHDVCISQAAFLCTGSHRWDSPNFTYDNAPIVIEPGVWLGAYCNVYRGVRVGTGTRISAHAVVVGDVPIGSVVGPNATWRGTSPL